MKRFSMLALLMTVVMVAAYSFAFANTTTVAEPACCAPKAKTSADCGCAVCNCPDCDGQTCSCDVCDCEGCGCAM